MFDKIITSDAQEALHARVGTFVQVWESGRHLKQASSPLFSQAEMEAFAPPKGQFLSRSVSLGNHELYGANRNNDGYPDAELKKSHDTFLTHGRVYREHRNKDPKKAIGTIKAAKYDSKLGWGELLYWTEIEKAAAEFEAARKGEEQHTSMATSVTHDICDGCGFKSTVPSERCDHIRNTPGAYMKEFQKFAHMINYGMVFKDQSWVGRPADRIANTRDYIFAKAASANRELRGDELAAFYAGSPWLESLRELAAFDQPSQDPALKFARQNIWANAVTGQLDETLVSTMANHPWPARVLRSLQKRAMVLPLASFEALISGRSVAQSLADPVVAETAGKMAAIRAIIISRSENEPEFGHAFDEAAQEMSPSNCECGDKVDTMLDIIQDQFSARYDLLSKRALTQDPAPPVIVKAGAPSNEALALGAIYNAYLLHQKKAFDTDLTVRSGNEILAAMR